MLAAERRARIVSELERHGSVRVRALVSLLGVSDMTVRRDLDVLQTEGHLFKVHGGATRHAERSTDEPGFGAKSGRRQLEKEAIALRAAELVEPGSAVAIGAGTTTWAMARHLLDVPRLTVVTNSVRVADLLHAHGRSDATVLLTGGLRTPSDALVGPLALRSLHALHTDVVFMGSHGMEPSSGFTTPNLLESETNRALVACASCLVVLADSSKWGVTGLSRFAWLSDADVLITDGRLPPDARTELAEQVGELTVVEPALTAHQVG
jgi:DeoR/GlpR family transcriptional regulator of sugar metabolism